MAVEVRIPPVLRKHTEGKNIVQGSGDTLAAVLESVGTQYPAFREQITDSTGQLHRFINLYVNDEDVRYIGHLETKLGEGDVVKILPAVAGG